MPQLDTTTWFTTVLSSLITLFMIMQLKIYLQNFPLNPTTKSFYLTKAKTPWEMKWTKIYLPLSLPHL